MGEYCRVKGAIKQLRGLQGPVGGNQKLKL